MTHAVSLSALEGRESSFGLQSGYYRELFHQPVQDSPLLLLSRSQVGRNYEALKSAMPRVDIHYAVKPNNHSVILHEVYKRGGNFDVCSAGEINLVLKTGVDPGSLIHSHPIKSIGEFDQAVESGVEMFVVDNPAEVDKLTRYTDKKLKILIRYRVHLNTQAVVNLQYKFGCTTDEVLPLAKKVIQCGHEVYGLCFHIGSQCVYAENYVTAIKAASRLIHQLADNGISVRLLDIGGGFPIEYVEPVPDIAEFAQPINRALDRWIAQSIRVISEPGRFIAGSAVTLLCSVVGKAYRDGKMWYYLDDGLYSTFSGIVFDHCQYPVVNDRSGEELLSVLAGPTCDSFDVMYDGLMMPEHEIGDRIMFTSTGAYCAVSGSGFNELRRPVYHIID
ncbi:type III PLP-dependent enzyme [candidate division GN15 bacterium]|nr:type III PLP-dependent enzyme [candidate division GN15 bacterium]